MPSSTIATEYTKTYTSFSGCDIVATFGGTVIGELQALTYSVQREKAPLYTMGSAEPRSFSRGKRGIAGTLVFTVFDRDALIEGLKEHTQSEKNKFHRIGKDINMKPLTLQEWDEQMTTRVNEGINGAVSSDATKATQNAAENATIYYADEIPPSTYYQAAA